MTPNPALQRKSPSLAGIALLFTLLCGFSADLRAAMPPEDAFKQHVEGARHFYSISDAGITRAFNETGTLTWQQALLPHAEIGSSTSATESPDGKHLAVIVRGVLAILRVTDGKILFQENDGEITGPPTWLDANSFVHVHGSIPSKIVCRDVSGATRWRTEFQIHALPETPSVFAIHGNVFAAGMRAVPRGEPSLGCLDRDGKLKWESKLQEGSSWIASAGPGIAWSVKYGPKTLFCIRRKVPYINDLNAKIVTSEPPALSSLFFGAPAFCTAS